uniref:Uncharacterized protein n=1 Tax=Arion vulgaris TaxID=1028688 RepID=A0A0B6Y0H9_9EUPU
MAAYRKYIICLLPIVMFVHTTMTFNVEELCAKRCLYGRGGVLCNCNAMHFNGKRSSYLSDHVSYGQGNRDTPDKNLGEWNLFDLESNVNDDSFHSHKERPLDSTRSDVDIDLLEASWNNRHSGNKLPNIVMRTVSGFVQKDNSDSPDDIHVNGNFLQPESGLLGSGGDIYSDKYINDRRREAASKIKEIMAAPLVVPSNSAAPVYVKDDFLESMQEDNDKEDWRSRQQLIRLNDVLSRVHQRR